MKLCGFLVHTRFINLHTLSHYSYYTKHASRLFFSQLIDRRVHATIICICNEKRGCRQPYIKTSKIKNHLIGFKCLTFDMTFCYLLFENKFSLGLVSCALDLVGCCHVKASHIIQCTGNNGPKPLSLRTKLKSLKF